MIKGKDR